MASLLRVDRAEEQDKQGEVQRHPEKRECGPSSSSSSGRPATPSSTVSSSSSSPAAPPEFSSFFPPYLKNASFFKPFPFSSSKTPPSRDPFILPAHFPRRSSGRSLSLSSSSSTRALYRGAGILLMKSLPECAVAVALYSLLMTKLPSLVYH